MNTVKVGMRFRRTEWGQSSKYILSRVETNKVCMVNLESGNRWNDAKKVKNSLEITELELKTLLFDDDMERNWQLYNSKSKKWQTI